MNHMFDVWITWYNQVLAGDPGSVLQCFYVVPIAFCLYALVQVRRVLRSK